MTWALLSVGMIGLVVGQGIAIRQARAAPAPLSGIYRKVADDLRSKGLPVGTMYEAGTIVGYFAGQHRRVLPKQDLATVLRYVRAHDGSPVYLAVSSSWQFYHPDVAALLRSNSPPFEIATSYQDSGVNVRVFRLQ